MKRRRPPTPRPGPPSENGTDPSADEAPWDGVADNSEKNLEAQPPTEAHDAAIELKELGTLDKLDWREYLENYSNNWQGGEPAPEQDDEHRQTLEATLTRKASLEDHLIWQLRLSGLSEADQRIGAAIIYNLNDGGYLETPIEELAAKLETDAPAFERVLNRIQQFDPPGVGARNLRECLHLQLLNLGMEESLSARIVLNHLDLLEKHRYGEIAQALRRGAGFGDPGRQDHRVARAQARPRLQWPGTHLHRARRLYPEGRRGIHRHAQ